MPVSSLSPPIHPRPIVPTNGIFVPRPSIRLSTSVGILLLTLGVIGFISATVALFVLSGVLFYRFFVHLTSAESSGMSQGAKDWFAESRTRFGIPVQPVQPPYEYNGVPKGKVID